MPYAHKVARVTFSGSVFTNTEIWTTGFYMGFEGADVTAVTPGMAQAVSTPFTAFWTSATSRISTSCYWRQTKVALINADGTTDEENVDYFLQPTPVPGSNGGAMLPAQIALVATLTSEFQRGLAAKGRMFLPGINATVDPATGKIPAADQGTIATNLETFFESVAALTTVPGDPILASNGSTPAQPARVGRNAKITGLRIGSVYDTQRRRRNQLLEGYVTRVITNA